MGACLDILGGAYDVGDDVYTIDPSGGGVSTATMATRHDHRWRRVDCVGQSTKCVWVGLSVSNVSESATHLSGAGTCYPTNGIDYGNGWYAIRGYACGNFTGQFNHYWTNDIAQQTLCSSLNIYQQTRPSRLTVHIHTMPFPMPT